MLALDHYTLSVTLTTFDAVPDAVKSAFSPGGDPDGSGSLPGSAGVTDSTGTVILTVADMDVAMLPLPRRLTFTFSSDVGAWKPSAPLILEGSSGGRGFRELIVPPANGGVVSTVHGYTRVDVLTIPPQPGDGQLQIGVSDYVFDGDLVMRAAKANGNGNLVVKYPGGAEDTIPVLTGQIERIAAREVLTTTTADLTLYF